MRNKYAGTCCRCGEMCPAGEGHFERFAGGWRVQHATCAIAFRGQGDPARDAKVLAKLRGRANETGKAAQNARRRLRDLEARMGGGGACSAAAGLGSIASPMPAAEPWRTAMADTCAWTHSIQHDDDVWETQCGEVTVFMAGDPVENRYRFCPYCGGKIVVAEDRNGN